MSVFIEEEKIIKIAVVAVDLKENPRLKSEEALVNYNGSVQLCFHARDRRVILFSLQKGSSSRTSTMRTKEKN